MKMLRRSRQFWAITMTIGTPVLILGIWGTLAIANVRATVYRMQVASTVRLTVQICQTLRILSPENALPPASQRRGVLIEMGLLPSEVFYATYRGRTGEILFTEAAEISSGTPIAYVDPALFNHKGTMIGYTDGVYFVKAPHYLEVIERLLPPPADSTIEDMK